MDTEARGHAIELCREAAHEGYDVVVAFGRGRTVNEAANGPARFPHAAHLSARRFGQRVRQDLRYPGELVDATEHLLGMADDWRPRKVDLGVVNGRCFTFASGLGLDASVVKRVDSNPHLKARFGAYYFTWAAVSTFTVATYSNPPSRGRAGRRAAAQGVTAIVQNGSPFTYFKDRPIKVAEALSSIRARWRLQSCVALDRLTCPRSPSAPSPSRHGSPATGRSASGRKLGVDGLLDRREPLPLQVDGDYLGERRRRATRCSCRALSVIS